ncbi:hypothetical protein KO317_01640 [Candidatus Micrarchaeota archaeon]|nr:hypothetical protein [Candidatus Micrarchaeota archaeon]
MKRLTKKTKKQIEMDFAFFIIAMSLVLFACIGFEKEVIEPKAVLPAPPVNDTINITDTEEPELVDIITKDPCKGLVGTKKRICLSIKENDFSICENDECLLEFAKNKSSEEACGEIEISADQYYCLSIIKNKEQCYLAPNNNAKDKCLADYAWHTKDESLCRKITQENSQWKKHCYLAIAVTEMDCKKCNFDTLGQSSEKDECRREYARLTGDTSCCTDLWSKSWENDCYRQAAFDNNNPSLCNGITNHYHRWQCYQGVFNSGNPKEIEECRNISDLEWEGRCIINIAVLQNNSEICEEITTNQEKDNCYLKFN